MALVWQKRVDNTLYEVRNAGQTLRLYTNGVFHSQLNPHKPVTGYVWDLLMLPALFYDDAELDRVLVLGVGGGAVIRLLQQVHFPRHVIGVELSQIHLTIARRFFGIKGPSVDLVHDDARHWLETYQGPPFRMIIDDLFAEDDRRAVTADADWMRKLLRHLTPDGVLVTNFIHRKEWRQCGYFSQAGLRNYFQTAFSLTDPKDENIVGVFVRKHVTSAMLRNRIREHAKLGPLLAQRKLHYNIRTLA